MADSAETLKQLRGFLTQTVIITAKTYKDRELPDWIRVTVNNVPIGFRKKQLFPVLKKWVSSYTREANEDVLNDDHKFLDYLITHQALLIGLVNSVQEKQIPTVFNTLIKVNPADVPPPETKEQEQLVREIVEHKEEKKEVIRPHTTITKEAPKEAKVATKSQNQTPNNSNVATLTRPEPPTPSREQQLTERFGPKLQPPPPPTTPPQPPPAPEPELSPEFKSALLNNPKIQAVQRDDSEDRAPAPPRSVRLPNLPNIPRPKLPTSVEIGTRNAILKGTEATGQLVTNIGGKTLSGAFRVLDSLGIGGGRGLAGTLTRTALTRGGAAAAAEVGFFATPVGWIVIGIIIFLLIIVILMLLLKPNPLVTIADTQQVKPQATTAPIDKTCIAASYPDYESKYGFIDKTPDEYTFNTPQSNQPDFINTKAIVSKWGPERNVDPLILMWWIYFETGNKNDAYSYSNCGKPTNSAGDPYSLNEACGAKSNGNWQLGYGQQFSTYPEVPIALEKAYGVSASDPDATQKVGQAVLDHAKQSGRFFPKESATTLIQNYEQNGDDDSAYWISVLERDPNISAYLLAGVFDGILNNSGGENLKEVTASWSSYYSTVWQSSSNLMNDVVLAWNDSYGKDCSTTVVEPANRSEPIKDRPVVPFFCQGNPAYQTCDLGGGGCGPTSMAMILSAFGIPNSTPNDVDQVFHNDGWRGCYNGAPSTIENGRGGIAQQNWLQSLGVTVGPNLVTGQVLDTDLTQKYIDDGYVILASSDSYPLVNAKVPGSTTSHIFVVDNINVSQDDPLNSTKVSVRDPNNCSYANGNDEYQQNIIRNMNFIPWRYAYPLKKIKPQANVQ